MDEPDPILPIEDSAPSEPAKKRNRFWDQWGGPSLTIALVLHAIVLILGALWIFQVIREPEKKIDFMPPGGGGGERGAETKVNTKKRQQITPTTNVKRVFAENAQSNYTIPDPGDNFGEMSALSSLDSGGPSGGLGGAGVGKGFGNGSGNGVGLSTGMGAGKLFGLIPESMRKRCSKDDRLQRLKENGGNPQCEEAVVKALRWLKSNQKADGSFSDGNFKVAMTGLALLAYFGHCETPVSEEFGDSCMKGIIYLVNIGMKNDGRMATRFVYEQHWAYEHGIATYALGEALTFCKEIKTDIPFLREVVEKAGQFILDSQNADGGWEYGYLLSNGHTDTSIVAWQIQALRAISHTGIKFRGMTKSIDLGLKYVNSKQDKTSGGFGYTNTSLSGGLDYYTLTGAGMLCNQMWGKGARSEVSKGAKYLLENSKFEYNGEYADLYGHYYESQAMMQKGGDDWKQYNNTFRDQLLNNQSPDGSWKVPGGGQKIRAVAPLYTSDDLYRTCLCTLMLEVYYRFLSTGGGGGLRTTGRPVI